MDNSFSHAKIDQIKSVSKARIQIKKNPSDKKYYMNYNIENGVFNIPKVSAEQIQLIDDAISQYRFESDSC